MALGAVVRHQMTYLLDLVLVVFDKVVDRIPPGQLEFRPTPDIMTAKQLAYHVYQLAYVLARAAETGTIDVKTLSEIPFDAESVRHPREIIEYGARVKQRIRAVVQGLSEEDLARRTTNGQGPNATAAGCLLLIVEEAIHHRGQLVTYLRLMGVKPPYLYDFDGEGRKASEA